MLLFLGCIARWTFEPMEPHNTSSHKLQISVNLPDIADKRPEPKRAVLLGIPAKFKNISHIFSINYNIRQMCNFSRAQCSFLLKKSLIMHKQNTYQVWQKLELQ